MTMVHDGAMSQVFPIRVGARSRLFLRVAFGVRPGRAEVEIDDAVVTIRFGWYTLRVPLALVSRWRIEGPWHWITAIGVRRSVRHGDISFAGSPRGGVRMDLRVRLRWGPLRLPAVYAGVEDLEGFAAAIAALGIPGEDARREPDGVGRPPAS
jgi:hypothetical protein